jgi:D-alanine transaminase
MSCVAYTDGRYFPYRSAAVHIEDRGYQFADGVYEMLAVVGSCLVDEERPIVRIDGDPIRGEIPGPLSRRLRDAYLAHAAAAA